MMAMATTREPTLTTEGNLRLASIPYTGVPDNHMSQRQQIEDLLADHSGIECYGPLSVFYERAPSDDAPDTWRGQVGLSIIGQVTPAAPLVVEDFRQLHALSLPHYGPISAIAETHARLTNHARAMGWLPRPYWRIAIAISRSPDDHLVPEPLISLFLDR